MWVILSKLEKMEIKKKGSSKLSSNTKFDKIIEVPKETKETPKKKDSSKNTVKKTSNKNNTNKKTSSKTNTKKNPSGTKKKSNNLAKRSNGYVSPKKRKKKRKK